MKEGLFASGPCSGNRLATTLCHSATACFSLTRGFMYLLRISSSTAMRAIHSIISQKSLRTILQVRKSLHDDYTSVIIQYAFSVMQVAFVKDVSAYQLNPSMSFTKDMTIEYHIMCFHLELFGLSLQCNTQAFVYLISCNGICLPEKDFTTSRILPVFALKIFI